MEHWLKISILLCIFGFLRELRPHEPFVAEYFTNYRNISMERLTNHFYPIGTYATMAQLVMIFLVTDFFKYKPIIILSALCGMLFCALMAWTSHESAVYVIQLSYGAFSACDIAYYTYIYAKVDKEKYQIVTGHTRSAILAGRFLGAVISQLLISFSITSAGDADLVVLSFATQCLSLVFAIFLPSVSASMYFYAKDANNGKIQGNTIASADKHPVANGNEMNAIENGKNHVNASTDDSVPMLSFSNAIKRIGDHVIASYSDSVVIQWSILWAISMCGFLQVQSYIQMLWKEISPDETDLYNGAVEALITLLGAMSAFAAGLLDSKKFHRYEVWILTVLTCIEACLLLWAAFTPNLLCCYVAYVAFGIIYQFMVTVASATIAKRLHEDCFALIFGINTLVALILQSIITFVAISQMNLLLRPQYKLYGCLFFVLAVFYGILGTSKAFFTRKKSCDLV